MLAIRILAGVFVLQAAAAARGDSLPLMFVGNHGQAHRDVEFMAKTPRLNAYFTRREAVFQLGSACVRVGFLGATGPRRIEAAGGAAGEANFLIGPEERWQVGLPLFTGVAYRDLYPGVDLSYRNGGPNLKSEFIVAPGGDPGRIRLNYEDGARLRLEQDGALSIAVGRHVLRESTPVIYQERDGARVLVEGGYQVDGQVVSFIIGGYDRSLPLIIDPVLFYLTLLGGSGADAAMSMAIDTAGSAYIAGFTSSYDFPTANPEQNFSGGGNEVFVAKLNASGSGLVYCTYIGGRGDDRAYGIAVDATGAAYIAGSTASSNFPTRNALQPKLAGGRNAFALKLNPAGNTLLYSTYLGGNGSDTANGIALDAAGNAYVAGDTTSTNFPATGFQRSNHGAPDGFVVKVAADGSRLLYSTYLGGAGEDHAAAIAVDATGSAFVTGSTYSPDFPVANAYQRAVAGGQDAFVTRLSADGNSLIFSTYLGGSGGMLGSPESGQGIAVDAQGNVYVAGVTSSANFPTRSPAQSTTAGWQDAFAAKFSASGTLLYSTYIGGVNIDIANAIAVDASGSAYVAGQTTSANLAAILISQNPPTGIFDAFVVKLAPTGNSVAALLYLGGVGADNATAIAVDAAANVYVAGWTLSPNFPIVSGFQTINGGNYSAFVGKVNLGAVSVSVAPPSATLSAAETQQFSATVLNAGNTAVTWSVSPAGVGSITASGLYTAPASVPGPQTVTVTATSVMDASKTATAVVSLSSRNLAAGKAASQSSTIASAANAVDGNTNGAWSAGSVTHTNLDAYAWWQVDLGASAAVDSIVIWNRTDCCGERLGDYWVFLSDTPFAPTDTPATLQSRTGTFSSHRIGAPSPSATIAAAGAHGRYLRVQLSAANYLSLAEVQVFGAIVIAPTNLAAGKAASQSSTVAAAAAANAVDGNINGLWSGGSVTHTNADPNAWWQVDLGASASISSVTVWNRTDCCASRLSDYWVFVSNTPFAANDTPVTLQGRAGTWSAHLTSPPNPSTSTTANTIGRYVRVQLNRTDYLHLAEVQVFGTVQ